MLEAREIRLGPDALRAVAHGFHEVRNRLPVLTRIHMVYTLTVPDSARETVEQALERHVARCPTAASLQGAVEVTWEVEYAER